MYECILLEHSILKGAFFSNDKKYFKLLFAFGITVEHQRIASCGEWEGAVRG